MTLDKTIKYYEELAEEQEKEYLSHAHDEEFLRSISHNLEAQIEMYSKNGCKRHAEEYRQLAKWLKELKDYKDARVGCEYCKHNYREQHERPCSLCQRNFMDMFERKVNADED